MLWPAYPPIHCEHVALTSKALVWWKYSFVRQHVYYRSIFESRMPEQVSVVYKK